jgi:hypothetical protein
LNVNDGDDSGSSSSDEEEEDNDHAMDGVEEENYSLHSENESDDEDSSDSEDEDLRGRDKLMSKEQDIPRVDNIPVVSKLAKEAASKPKGKFEQLKESKDRVKSTIEADHEELETHFVDNPFIRVRERAL